HYHRQIMVRDALGVPPYPPNESRPSDHAARVPHQVVQQLELSCRQPDTSYCANDLAPWFVEPQSANGQRRKPIRIGEWLSSTEHRLDVGQQGHVTERLHQIIIGA